MAGHRPGNRRPVSESRHHVGAPFSSVLAKFFGGLFVPSAWISISTPPPQTQLLLYISLNLLVSQPLLPIKLDIREIHQASAARGYSLESLCLNRWCCVLDGPKFIYRITWNPLVFTCAGVQVPSYYLIKHWTPLEGLSKIIPWYYHLAFLQLFIFYLLVVMVGGVYLWSFY